MHALFVEDGEMEKRVFLATWKDIPAQNEVQHEICNVQHNAGTGYFFVIADTLHKVLSSFMCNAYMKIFSQLFYSFWVEQVISFFQNILILLCFSPFRHHFTEAEEQQCFYDSKA